MQSDRGIGKKFKNTEDFSAFIVSKVIVNIDLYTSPWKASEVITAGKVWKYEGGG